MADAPSRDEALALVHEYTENENLRRHMYAVEAAMRAYARKYGEDEDLWGITGLIHDFDYERWPNDGHAPDEEHPSTGVAILRERGWPEEILHAVMAHADYTGVVPETRMARALRAVDELTGFIVACALVRPNKISDLKPKSVKKKLKDTRFAAAVSREHMRRDWDALGVDHTEHIQAVIDAMRGISDELGLSADG
ncbi:MAG: HDIG domain-containing metalloprotein [Gemmatimonadota bacterium]